jgi:type IV pilus assembly protein PilO
MPRSFNPAALRAQNILRDPRVTMRVTIGVLLAANLAMAVLAFKPFGGSADDLARQQTALQAQLDTMNNHIRSTRQMVEKVQSARAAGNEFLNKYFTQQRSSMSDLVSELQRIAAESGVTAGPDSFQQDDVEGSDSLKIFRMQVGCEGSYQSLAKFVNLLDKSKRFFIVENMHANAVQNGQKVNVSFKIDAFTVDDSGAGL